MDWLFLLDLQIIDEIIEEPVGGAHRDKDLILKKVKDSISRNLENFKTMSKEEIFNERKNKFLRIGRNKGFMNDIENLSSLKSENNKIRHILNNKKNFLIFGLMLIMTAILLIVLY